METQGGIVGRENECGPGLRIDKVLSTQPELGPSVPDGGYGWIILIGAMFFQLTIPSLSIAFGVFLMFSTLEGNASYNYLQDGKIFLWENVMIYTSIFFIAIWTITDPICRLIVANSRWPRLVGLGGTCLVCAGVLFFWLALVNPHLIHEFLYSFGGVISGIGAALILTQCEILVSQFFRLKLASVNLLLWMISILGFAITPVVLGYFINRHGLPHVIIWYHLYILSGVIVCGMFKKPDYLRIRQYNPVRRRHDEVDEEDVFSKIGTELKIARHHLPTSDNLEAGEEPGASGVHSNTRTDWERFSDDEDEEEIKRNGIRVSNGNCSPNVDPPRDLFTELQLNNNTTYSFDNANLTTASDDTYVFMPVLPATNETYKFFIQPSFYKSVFLQVTIKFSMFGFYTAYPSMLYFSIPYLHKESVTSILGYIFCSCLLVAFTVKWIKVSRTNRVFFISLLSWSGSIGMYMIGGTRSLAGKITGGLFTGISLFMLEHFSETYLKLQMKSEPSKMYIYLNLFSGLSLSLLTTIDLDLIRFFQVLGTLQFLNGSIWFGAYVLKKVKGGE